MYPELAERWERLREQLDALVLVDQKDRQETWRLEMEEKSVSLADICHSSYHARPK